jgi:hypothetical protein
MKLPIPTIPMKTTPIQSFLVASWLCSVLTLPLAAQGPGGGGRGPGHGGGRGPGGGGPGGFQEAIHTLFDNHTKIKRSVEVTATGYKSRTVSDDPEITKTLQKHVREMRERLGAGLMIRRWDPAFAELVEHYEAIDHEFKEVDGGVEMIASGRTPEAVKVTQNHARIVSGFVEKGPAQMHEKHARALTADTPAKPDDSDAQAPAADHDHDAPADEPSESSPTEPKAKAKACCPKEGGQADAAGCPESTKETKEAQPTKPGCCQAKKCCAKKESPQPAR